MPTDDDCHLYSTPVSQYWNPDRINVSYSKLESFTCFSSWHARNDIVQSADITGTDGSFKWRSIEKAKDGFFCKGQKMAYGYVSKPNHEGWMQIDLKKYYALKCLKIFVGGTFNDIEFRFGNYSKNEDWTKNAFLAYSSKGMRNTIVKYCFDRPMVGRYVYLESKKKIDEDIIQIGEIQVLVQ